MATTISMVTAKKASSQDINKLASNGKSHESRNVECCLCGLDQLNEKSPRLPSSVKTTTRRETETKRIKRSTRKNQITKVSDCAKCQLIVDWTLAQAKLASAELGPVDDKESDSWSNCSECEECDSSRFKIVPRKSIQSREFIHRNRDNWTDEAEISSLTDSNQDNNDEESKSKLGALNNGEKMAAPRKKDKIMMLRRLPLRLSAKFQASKIGEFLVSNNRNKCIEKENDICINGKRRQAPMPPDNNGIIRTNNKSLQEQHGPTTLSSYRLLSETEVNILEQSLKSHKSSVYVAGCLANLYLTKTKLVDNGRQSRPENDGWQLKQVGVPVLTFDSGLARNRRKRQLKVNLAERESGFVLWSDTIDHLSNYRPYESSEDEELPRDRRSSKSFHVMYLSTDHRIMVGLAFDDSVCAQLFLSQIELVTSDPRNIALTGPKRSNGGSNLNNCTSKGPNYMITANSQTNSHMRHGGLKNRVMKHFIVTNHHLNNLRLRQVEYGAQTTWSTLKRAMRLSQLASANRNLNSNNNHNQNHDSKKTPIGSDNKRSEHSDNNSRVTSNATRRLFRPKPLAELAIAGENCSYFDSGINRRSGCNKQRTKRAPRKCDISAPCLFQHVTGISQSQLNQLQSGLLVNNGEEATINNVISSDLNSSTLTTTTTTSISNRDHFKITSSSDKFRAVINLDRTERVGNNRGQQMEQIVAEKEGIKSLQDSSSSSCGYSSGASISSPGSEFEPSTQAQTNTQSKLAIVRKKVGGKGRPAPPIRRISRPGLSSKEIELSVPPPPPPPPPPKVNNNQKTPGGAKIHAVIRELESHASAEMVSAKRRLMADIAGQLEARKESNRKCEGFVEQGAQISHL